MDFHAKQSLHHVHGISTASFHCKSWWRRLRAALAASCRAVAEISKVGRDYESPVRMTEYQLRDIGLHRVESVIGVHIVPLGDAEP